MAAAFPTLSQNGMFELPLRASYSKDKGRFTHRIVVLQGWMKCQEVCHQNAIQNLIGVLQYYMGNRIKALSYFKTVLENDPVNLNALGNSSFVYRRLGRSSKAFEMENRLREANTQEEPVLRVLQGRYWAEQAHALSSEIIEGTRHQDFDLESNKFYEVAFRIAGQHFEEAELGAWQFSAAINYRRLAMKWETLKKNRKESFSRSIELFCKAKATPDSLYIADCWCHIGMLMNGAKWGKLYAESLPPPVEKYNLAFYYENPEECYLTALRLQPNNWHSVNKYVRFLLKRTQNSAILLDALGRIQGSLELQSNESNWFGYSTRAELLQKLSFKQNTYLLEACKHICGLLSWEPEVRTYLKQINDFHRLKLENAIFDKAQWTGMQQVIHQLKHDLLLKAEEDMKKVLVWNPTTKGFLVHGQISYNLARLEKRRGLPFEEWMEQALEMFQHATDMAMQGQERLPNLHQVHGNCLRDMGEYRNAAEAYKLALEASINYNYNRPILIQVVDSLLLVYKEEREQTLSALYEAVYWFLTTCDKYPSNFLTTLSIDKLRIHHPKALENMILVMRNTNFGVALTSGFDCANALEAKLKIPLAQSPARTGGNSPSGHSRTPDVESESSFFEDSGYFSRLEIDPMTGLHQTSPQPSPQQSPPQLKDEAAALKSEVQSVDQEVSRAAMEGLHIQHKLVYPERISVHARDTGGESSSPKDSCRTVPEVGAPPQEARNRKGKKFDFFVSHSGEDKYWVLLWAHTLH